MQLSIYSSSSTLRRVAQVLTLLLANCLTVLISEELTCTASADDRSTDPVVDEEASFFIREALNARNLVHSGRVTITGRLTALLPDGTAGLDGPITGLYVFDREANLFRYEGEAPCNVAFNRPGNAFTEHPNRHVPYGFCRASDYFASWSEIGPNTVSGLNLYPLAMERDVWLLSCWRKPLDVMAFGVHGYLSLSGGWETVDAYDFWLDFPEHSVLEANEQTATIELRRGDFVCTIVFDRDLMAPIQLDHGVISDPAQFQSTTEWQVVEGVAVPVRYSTRFTTPNEVQVFEAELEWLSVNEEIPSKEFEYTAFHGLTPGVHDVYDQRSDPVTHLGIWVSDGVVKPRLEP